MKKLTNKHFLNVPALLIVLFTAGIFISSGAAQTFTESSCAMKGTGTTTAEQLGGMWQTSLDTLNVVVVFVQFPDDMYDTTYSGWPTKPLKGEYPGPTYLRTFIDSTRFQMSTNGNLTHFFRQMSMGNFTLIGKARFIVTPHTRQWYLDNGWQRWRINMEVLQTLDANFDFAPFDKYRFYSTYDIRKEPDGRVDDIFMIYRNIAHDLPDTFEVMNDLDFFPAANGYAESSLGYASGSDPISFNVDGGLRRIYHAHPAVPGIADTLGLGTTSVLAGSGDSWTGNPPYRPQIHEFAHHWMTNGTDYGHNGAGFWGMLDAWGSRKNNLFHPVPNSWEREVVGWIAPDSIYQTTYGVTLTDYVTTGSTKKLKVPGNPNNPQEFFRLEYHAKTSSFDNPEVWDAYGKGLYIIHQTGNTDPQSQLRLIPADGRWNWISDEYVYRPYTIQAIPVLEKTGIDRVNGIDDSRAITYTWTGGSHPPLANPFWIHVYRDRATNQLIDKTVFLGDGQDAFGYNKNRIFSPWSNPNSYNNLRQSTGIAIEVVSEDTVNRVITLNIYFSESAALTLAPSKPQDVISSLNTQNQAVTTWAANIEDDVTTGGGYNIYREIYYGTTVVSNVKLNSSLLTGTSYTDNNIALSAVLPNGTNLYVRYKIEAVDNQGKVSVKATGNSIFLGVTQQVSGTVSTTTWTGVKFITGNITVNSGNTLTVSPNTFVFFTASKQLIIHGKIDADNSTFQALSGVTHYGIIVDGPVKSYFDNCNVKGGTYGLIVDGSTSLSPEARHCDIQGGTAGVWIRNSGNPYIDNSFLKATSNTGAVVLATNNATGRFVRCKLDGTARYGHRNENTASTMYGYNGEARNIIDGTQFTYTGGIVPAGIYVTGGYPYFYNGKNYIVYRGSYYYQYHNNYPGSTQDARGNYWGGGAPVISGYTVNYSPYLTTLPNPIGPSWSLPKSNPIEEENPAGDDLTKAWQAFFDEDYNQAKDIAREVFQTKNKTDQSSEALFLWMKSSLQEKSLEAEENSLSSFSRNSSIHESAKYESLRWLAKLAVYSGDFKKAEEYALSIPNTSLYGREILFDLAVEILERWNDIDNASLVLDELVKRYPDKETAMEKEFIVNIYSEYISQMDSGSDEPGILSDEVDINTMNLLEAYPNPFNPITTIQFQIPAHQNFPEIEILVSLKVYDVLGKEVVTLVNEMKKPGSYKVTFDASNLASGMYIYRLQTDNFILSKKMMLVK